MGATEIIEKLLSDFTSREISDKEFKILIRSEMRKAFRKGFEKGYNTPTKPSTTKVLLDIKRGKNYSSRTVRMADIPSVGDTILLSQYIDNDSSNDFSKYRVERVETMVDLDLDYRYNIFLKRI